MTSLCNALNPGGGDITDPTLLLITGVLVTFEIPEIGDFSW